MLKILDVLRRILSVIILSCTLCVGPNQLILAEDRIVCDSEELSIKCSNLSDVVVIVNAVYGRTTTSKCGRHEMQAPCSLPTSMQIVNKLCFGLPDCKIKVGSSIFHNPCNIPSTELYLNVSYQCIPDEELYDASITEYTTSKIGYLTSPYYPNKYDRNIRSVTKIKVAAGYSVQLTLLDLEIEARVTTGCYDRLVIRENTPTWMRHEYCGNMLTNSEPTTLVLHEPVIEFKTDGVHEYRGFLIQFKAIKDQDNVPKLNLLMLPENANPDVVNMRPVAIVPTTHESSLLENKSHETVSKSGQKTPVLNFQLEDVGREGKHIKSIKKAIIKDEQSNQDKHKVALPNHDIHLVEEKAPGRGNYTKVPTCSEITLNATLPEYVVINLVPGDDTATLSCIGGYRWILKEGVNVEEMTNHDAPKIVYCKHGQWDFKGFSHECKEIKCAALGPLEGGRTSVDGFSVGRKATYECSQGFQLFGVQTRVCLNNGLWSGSTPWCRPKSKRDTGINSIVWRVSFILIVALVLFFRKRLHRPFGAIRQMIHSKTKA